MINSLFYLLSFLFQKQLWSARNAPQSRSNSFAENGFGWRVTGKGVVRSAKDHLWRKVFRINPDLTHTFSTFIHLSHIWNDAKINNSLNDFGINICNHYCCFLLAEYSSSIVHYGLGWRVTGKGVVISAKDHPWGKVFRIHPDLLILTYENSPTIHTFKQQNPYFSRTF